MSGDYMEDPPANPESVPLSELSYRIDEQLTRIQQLQCQRRYMGRVYARLRRHHGPMALRRALRRQLKAVYKLQTEWMEVLP